MRKPPKGLERGNPKGLGRGSPKGYYRRGTTEGILQKGYYRRDTTEGVLQKGYYRGGGRGSPEGQWYGWIQEGMTSKLVITNCNCSSNTSF